MSTTTESPAGAALAPEPVRVPVWDWPVRLVHWSIVLLVVVLVVTGTLGDDALVWHMRAGQTLLALVLFRVAWGFVGSRHARFASFVRGPAAVLRYARTLVRPPHEVHATHNPLGGWMVVLLLVALLVQAATGLCTNDDILAEGPLVRYITKELSDTIGSFHRRFAWVVVGLASAHILAVLAYLVVLRDNLIAPMVSGAKRLPVGVADANDARASSRRAILLLALSGVAVWLIVRVW